MAGNLPDHLAVSTSKRSVDVDVHANENMPIPGSDEYWRCRRQAFVLIRNLEPGPGRYFRTVHHDDAASNPVVREILKAQNRLHLLTPAKGFEELGWKSVV